MNFYNFSHNSISFFFWGGGGFGYIKKTQMKKIFFHMLINTLKTQ